MYVINYHLFAHPSKMSTNNSRLEAIEHKLEIITKQLDQIQRIVSRRSEQEVNLKRAKDVLNDLFAPEVQVRPTRPTRPPYCSSSTSR